MSENDFDSPGYEYLRLYQNMNNLYYKLITLNYQKEFCSIYKCPPIHRYYFSLPSDNANEQLFIYTCLCAWLIKEKCQMNLSIEPEEYEDVDVTISVITEALGLLLGADDTNIKSKVMRSLINFPPGRLKSGYGPEVVWSLNIFADRALELMLESEKQQEFNGSIKIVYYNKNGSSDKTDKQTNSSNYITIGQPFVGGGLTTRPLGSYKIDDKSLLFDCDSETVNNQVDDRQNSDILSIEPENWRSLVQTAASTLKTANLVFDRYGIESWQNHLQTIRNSTDSIQEFSNNSKPILVAITNRIDRHLDVIKERESFIQTKMKLEVDEFLEVYREYLKELKNNSDLNKLVLTKTDMFENSNDKLKEINLQVESRIIELDDGSKLRELESMINRLKEENLDFGTKIGLLLTLYAKKTFDSSSQQQQNMRAQFNPAAHIGATQIQLK